MALKATVTKSDGTVIVIEGTSLEVQAVLAGLDRTTATQGQSKGAKPAADIGREGGGSVVDVAAIITKIKSCDEADAFAENVLDSHSQVARILLPLYVVHEYFENSVGLTSGEIAQVTKELGVAIKQSNIATLLSSSVSKYVLGNKIRRKGSAVHYKISRKGVQHLKDLLVKGK